MNGFAKVHIYQHAANGTFRIVGRLQQDHSVRLDVDTSLYMPHPRYSHQFFNDFCRVTIHWVYFGLFSLWLYSLVPPIVCMCVDVLQIACLCTVVEVAFMLLFASKRS
jgi:hypothetical protein